MKKTILAVFSIITVGAAIYYLFEGKFTITNEVLFWSLWSCYYGIRYDIAEAKHD